MIHAYTTHTTHMHFEIDGLPVPYYRMTQRSKWVDKGAQRYLSSQDYFRVQFQHQMHIRAYERIARSTPIRIEVTFISEKKPNHNRDLSNLLKAVEDAANKIVWDDDRWVDSIVAIRKKGLRDLTSIDVFIQEV